MNRNLQRHEDAIKKYQAENNELMQDLMHSRELNARLEGAKEELTRHLTSKELDNEQLNNIKTESTENQIKPPHPSTQTTTIVNKPQICTKKKQIPKKNVNLIF